MYGKGTYTFADGDTVTLSPIFMSKTSFEGWEVNGETREDETIEITIEGDTIVTLNTEEVEETEDEICSLNIYTIIGVILVVMLMGFGLYKKSK